MATNLHKLLLFIFAALLVAACDVNVNLGGEDEHRDPAPDPTDPNYGFSEPVTEELPYGGYVTFQYNEDVTVEDENALNWVDHVEADTIIYFKGSMPQEIRPLVGEHITARASELFPYGLAHVVLSASDADGLYRCVTTAAPLEDIFKVLQWNIPRLPLIENIESISLCGAKDLPVSKVEVQPDMTRSGDKSEPQTMFEVKLDIAQLAALAGTIELGANALQAIDAIQKHGVCEISYKFNTFMQTAGDLQRNYASNKIINQHVLGGQIGVKTSATKGLTDEDKEKIALNLAKLLKFTGPIVPITVGPIVLVSSVDFAMDFELEVTGSATIGGDVFKFQTATDLSDGHTEPTSYQPEVTFDITGGIGFYVVPKVELGLGLFTKGLGVAVIIDLTTGAEANLDLGKLLVGPQTLEDINADFTVPLSVGASLTFGITDDLFKEKQPFLSRFFKSFRIPSINIGPLYQERLLPSLVKGSHTVRQTSFDPLQFVSNYNVNPGLLASLKLLDVQGGVRVERDEETVLTDFQPGLINEKDERVELPLNGLVKSCTYKAIPIVRMWDHEFPLTDGIPFSSEESDQQPKLITHIGNLFTMAYDAQGRVVNIASYAEGLEFFELDYDHMTVHYENDDEEDTFVGTFQLDNHGRLAQIDGRYPDGETQSISFTYNAGGYIDRIYNHFSEGDSYTNNFTWKGSLLTEVALIERSEGESDLSTYKYTYTDVANRTRQYVASLCMNNNFWWPVSGLLGEGPARLPAQLVIEEDGDSELLNITYTLDDDGAVRTEYIEGIALNYTYTTDGAGVKASAATLPQHPQLKPSWHRSQVRKSHP